MTETPRYSVLQKDGKIELREYEGYIQAEVDIRAGDYRTAIEAGFNVLAGYIFGNNISRQKIEMTAPVQAARSEKIAMTAPVTVTGEGVYTVAFVMPSRYTLQTLPEPKDQAIRFVQLPIHRMAAIRFSGFFKQKAIEENRKKLSGWLAANGLETGGDFIAAGYDPPWVPWFLSRNELMIRLIL